MLLQSFIDKMEPKATFRYLHSSSAIQNYRLLKVAAKEDFLQFLLLHPFVVANKWNVKLSKANKMIYLVIDR